ncbi:gastrula zinc finger protein XlCGF57.1-like protein [Aphelenchoides avenae]|nr:gastrula zinc finger protein XlCGF57.1-like protein [Aphelenchus avenae]
MDLGDIADFKPPKIEPTDTDALDAKPLARPSCGNSAATLKLETRPMTCTRCSAVFTKRAEWIEHVRKHPAKTPGKTFTCPYDGCEFATTMDYNLKGHIRAAHTNEKPFKCDACDAAFARKSDFNRHVQRMHEKKTYDCPECDHVAKNVEKLKQHVKEEHGKVVTTE